jgi:2-keto-4-pentenoate hydratase/2-oxohepta-3-ene-1,7-dioic acid hydratase in catechol pathway
MRIVRYQTPADARYGLIEGNTVYEAVGEPFEGLMKGSEVGPLENVKLLTPVTPTTIVCVGNNYNKLLKVKGISRPEIPNVFLKAVNALAGPDDNLIKPRGIERFEFEGELTLVISKTASKIEAANWRDYVLGFTIGNDMSAREWQQKDTQWWRAKSADTFCPVGPWIETELDHPENLKLRTLVNGEVKQDSSTQDLTFSLGEVLEIVTSSITLQPGDIVLTGTPPGFVPLQNGDVVEVEIEGIGTLRNTVVEEGIS